MGKWVTQEESGEEQGRGPRSLWRKLEGAGGGRRVRGGRRPAVCRASAGGDPAPGKGEQSGGREGGRDPSPGSRKSVRSGGWWYVWFCFQKYSSGLAATFKELKIWKQALGKRSTENSSGEDGSAEPGAPAEPDSLREEDVQF